MSSFASKNKKTKRTKKSSNEVNEDQKLQIRYLFNNLNSY